MTRFIWFGIAACTLSAQYNDADHVSACVHYGDCDVSARIAQGSVFDAFGSTRGPAPARVVSAFPLSTNLAGVSVQIRVGDRAADAWIVSIEPGLILDRECLLLLTFT